MLANKKKPFIVVCVFVWGALGSSYGSSVFGQDANAFEPGAQQPSTQQPSEQRQQQSQNRTTIVANLAREIDDLIPTDYLTDTAKAQALKAIANSFVDGNTAAVDQQLKSLADRDPDFPPAELLKAGMHYSINDIKGGGELLESLAIKEPGNPAVFIAFSRLAYSQQRITDALALVEKAQSKLQTASSSAGSKKFMQTQVADLLTLIAVQQNRLPDADKYAEAWEKLAPSSAKMLLGRAEIKYLQKDLPAAQQFLAKLKQARPSSRPAEVILASWSQTRGDAAGVATWIKSAVAKYPDDAAVQLEYANWALSVEDFKTATAAVAKFESLDKPSLNSKLLRARVMFSNQDYVNAEKLLDELFVARSSSFDISNLYVLTLIESSDAEKQKKASQIAQRNLQALPNNLVARAAIGWVLFKSGDVKNGSTILAGIARSNELPPEVTFFVASMLEQIGQNTKAQKLLEPALKSKGMFLYRSRAKQLYDRLSSSELPAPSKK